MSSRSLSARARLRLALPVVCGFLLIAPAASANGRPAPSPTPAVPSASPSGQPDQAQQQAQQQLQQAQQNAAATDSALAQAQGNLAASRAHLAELQQQIADLDAQIGDGQARVDALRARADQDRAALGVFLRNAYEGQSSNSSLAYVLASDNFSQAIQRDLAVDSIANAGRDLVSRINAEQAGAQRAVDQLRAQRAQLDAAQLQAQTTAQLVAIEEQQVAHADTTAHQAVASSQVDLKAAEAAKQLYDRAVAQLAAERASNNVIFAPVPGVKFTVDTDLTQPSGETVVRLNHFLAGTALHDLGQAYMDAETKYHVSARYLLAHSIEESAFGTSQIAQDKHNLYGYGANDANPYQDAVTFPSFAACIDFVSQKVAQDYLAPTGQYYHGPTLRGMNVDYATDPNWSANIAQIANSFP